MKFKKNNIKNLFYNIVIFLLKFKFFQYISKYFVNAYLINKGYCLDWNYLISKSSNNLFLGENIFLSKLNKLNIKNCIDVGSNIGDFSKEILKNKNTNVIAFEPIPECFSSLKKIKNDYGDRFIYFKCALSNKKGSAYINFNKNSHDLASLESSINKIDYIKKKNVNKLNIELEKLDNFIDKNYFRNIDFIKIDTEGHEIKVLEGAMNFLNKNKVKLIQIEFNLHHLFVNNSIFQFSEILKDYVVTQMNLVDGRLFVVDQNHYQSNLFQLSNFVFVEKEFFEKNFLILLS